MKFERDYWGDCCNTFDEEQKHYVYARHMFVPVVRYGFDARGSSVLDVGGGPVSMLLKTVNLRRGLVVDPLEYPMWTQMRYTTKGVEVKQQRGEDMDERGWDECWIYNVLQHVDDPALVVANARRACRILRVFEWLDVPPHEGHPNMLTEALLNGWIGQDGCVTLMSQSGCHGRAYHGAFA